MSGLEGPSAGQADPPKLECLSLRSSDLDEIRSFGGTHYYPRRFLHLLRPAARPAAGFDLQLLGPLSIGDVWYGADVTLGYEEPDAYHVDVPVAGHLEAHQGGRTILGTVSQASVFRIGEDVVLDRWSADCRQLSVKIERGLLDRQLQALLDAPVHLPIRLPAQLDITQGRGRSWAALIRWIADEFGNRTGLVNHPLIVEQLLENLTIGLLLATDHPHRAALYKPDRAYRTQPVRRAIDAMQAHPERPFTAATLARTAGVSVRTLQEGFRRYVGITPMAYLRQVRLVRAHEELRVASPYNTTVTEVAYGWGFLHLGRFAAAYRAQYNVTPSQTLKT
jgi:AraC-like DNA-binding protein